MTGNDRQRRMTRLTMGAVAAATLALAGCSSGGDWPTGGAASAAAVPTSEAPAPATDTPASNAASGSGDAGAGSSGGGAGSSGGGAPGGSTGGGENGDAGGGNPDPGGNPARCTTAELKGTLGPGEGAAGSVMQTLILTNVGSRTCSLRGFPGVSYVGGDGGTQVGPSAAMSGPRGADVRLGAGSSAGAPMKLANVGKFDPEQCKPVPVRGLRVYPPGDTSSLFVAREGTGCSATPSGGDQLSVQTLAAR